MQFAERVRFGMTTNKESRKVRKKIFALLPQKQKLEFFLLAKHMGNNIRR